MDTFFAINMPYGLRRNKYGQWMVFNREYMPLGYNSTTHQESMSGFPDEEDYAYKKQPIYTSYEGLTEKLLLLLADDNEDNIRRDNLGRIYGVHLYDMYTCPINFHKPSDSNWTNYTKKLKIIAELRVLD